MRVTPLDIIQKRFSSHKKGFDPEEVTTFLDELRETLEALLRENHEQRASLKEREREVAEFRSGERELKETLIVARQFADDLKNGARRESDIVLGEARLEAQRVISRAHDEHRELLQEVLHLKAMRARLIAEIRAVLQTHASILDDLEQDGSVAGIEP